MEDLFVKKKKKIIKITIAESTENVYYITRQNLHFVLAQPAFTCSKLTIETLEQGVKYVQS